MSFAVIAAIVLGAIALIVGWYSVQSVRQGILLRRADGLGHSGFRLDAPIAMRGVVVARRPLNRRGPCLYYKVSEDERRGWGRHRHWHTVGVKEQLADFVLVCDGQEVEPVDLPTETPGADGDTTYDGGWFQHRTRTIETWIPVTDELTIVGRATKRGNRVVIVRDPTLGLLMTAAPLARAAMREFIKGLGGLLLIVSAAAFAAWWWMNWKT